MRRSFEKAARSVRCALEGVRVAGRTQRVAVGERMIDRLDEKTAQEIWISCDEKGLEEYKKKLGPFSERFLG